MKPITSRFSTLKVRAEYLKLKVEKEKEKEKKELENEDEEEEEDELEDKNKQNIQKPKNIPISKTPISSLTSLNRINDKQKISHTSQIPYNFTKSRLNYTQSSNNPELNTKNPKDILIMRQGIQDKKLFQLGGTPSAKNIITKTGQNQNFSIKQSQNSPKGLKSTSILENNSPQILKATYSHSNLNTNKVTIPGNKYSSIRRFGETITKQDENKNEIKIINKNNNYTINVTNNNNTITVNNNNISNNNVDNFEKINENKNDLNINIEEKKEEEILPEINKESNVKLKSKKEPRKDITKTNNLEFNSLKKDNENIIREEKKEVKKINIQKDEEEEEEEEMNLTKKEKEKEIDTQNKKRPEYVSDEQMIKNGIEIVKFSEEETNKVYQQKAENKEKKINKLQKKEKEKEKKEKYKNKTYYNNDNDKYINDNNNNKRETFIFHKRGANNFMKRGHYYYRTSHNDLNEYNNDIYEHRYNNFYERGRPNPIYKGTRGRRGRYRY